MPEKNFFESETKSIHKVLGDYYYVVKNYQRTYAWETEHVEKFITDIHERFSSEENQAQPYFMGSIIVSGRDDALEIIDGQQRLTTFIIATKVIHTYFGHLLTKETKRSKDIRPGDLQDIFILANDDNRLRIEPRERAKDFENIVIKSSKEELEKIRDPANSRKNPDVDDVKSRYRNSIRTIITRLEDPEWKLQSGDSFQKFINYFYDNVFLVFIKAEDTHRAIELFKIINTRGMDLTEDTIIKADLLASGKNREKNITEEWRKMEDLLDNRGCEKEEAMSHLLTLYQYYFLGVQSKQSYLDDFEKIILKKFNNDGWELTQDLSNFAEGYPCLGADYQGSNYYMMGLNYLKWNVYWKAILITAKKEGVNDKDYDGLTKLICSYFYIHWILGSGSPALKTAFFKVIQQLKTPHDESLEQIRNTLKEDIVGKYEANYLKKIEDILRGKSGEVDREKWIKPVLMMLSYRETAEGNRKFFGLKKGNANELEHVVPQSLKDREKNYPDIQNWDEFDKKYLSSLGNLTLLEKPLNASASNGGPKFKVGVYNDRNGIGGTSFAITRNLIDDFNRRGKIDLDFLDDRGLKMAKDIRDMFSVFSEAPKRRA